MGACAGKPASTVAAIAEKPMAGTGTTVDTKPSAAPGATNGSANASGAGASTPAKGNEHSFLSAAERRKSFRKRRLTIDASVGLFPDAAPPPTGITPKKKLGRSRRNRWSMSEDASWELNYATPVGGEIAGVASLAGMEPKAGGVSSKINQDRGCISNPLGKQRGHSLFAVFDGHGPRGDAVSAFVVRHVHDTLDSGAADLMDPRQMLRMAFMQADKDLQASEVESNNSGTTAIVCYIREKTIYTACAGDSRACIGRRDPDTGKLEAIPLSKDQKPDDPDERQRIHSMGGYVSEESWFDGPARVWITKNFGPGLAMARSIGDHTLAPLGVIAEPVITEHEMKETDELLILASDGVWEFIDCQQATDIMESFGDDANEGIRTLVVESSKEWLRVEEDYRDDITAIGVWLKPFMDWRQSVDHDAFTSADDAGRNSQSDMEAVSRTNSGLG
jgi:serine/threonine protein phosphatase PrpC